MNELLDFSVAGAVVVLVVREVFTFLKERKPILEPNPHPDEAKSGDLAATYWLTQFDKLNASQGEMQTTLNEIRTLLHERMPRR